MYTYYIVFIIIVDYVYMFVLIMLEHCDVKMVIANNNNHADDNGPNNDNDGEDLNGVVTDDEDSMELEENCNINLIIRSQNFVTTSRRHIFD